MKALKFAALALTLMGAGCSTDDASNSDTPDGGSGPVGGSSGTGGASGTSAGGVSGSAGSGGPAGSAGSGGAAGLSGENGGSAGGSGCASTGGADSVTSLCGERALNTLTGAEATALCSDTVAYVSRSLGRANACKYYALITSASSSAPSEPELQAGCVASESACNQPGSTMGTGMNTLCTEIPATCTATVLEYSRCVKDETTLFDQGVNDLPACSALTFATVSQAFDLPTAAGQVTSCMMLTIACPGFAAPYIN